MTRHGDLMAPPLYTGPLCITEQTIVTTGVFVCQSTHTPFHWFNCDAYLKLGVSMSCQL